MPKSPKFTAYELFVDQQTRKWLAKQDLKSKFGKLSKKKQDHLAELATQLNGPAKKQIKPVSVEKKASVEQKKPVEQSDEVEKKEKTQKKPAEQSAEVEKKEKRPKKATGYSVFAKWLRDKWAKKWREESIPMPSVTPAEMRQKYASVSDEKKQKFEAHAAELNAANA